MRPTPWHKAEPYRVAFPPSHPFNSIAGDDFGVFEIPGPCGQSLKVIVGNGMGWEHVSISCRNRCPNWPEMSHIKEIFWGDDECVMQLHPPKSDYINCHPYCLHLWKPIGQDIPRPPSVMVGYNVERYKNPDGSLNKALMIQDVLAGGGPAVGGTDG